MTGLWDKLLYLFTKKLQIKSVNDHWKLSLHRISCNLLSQSDGQVESGHLHYLSLSIKSIQSALSVTEFAGTVWHCLSCEMSAVVKLWLNGKGVSKPEINAQPHVTYCKVIQILAPLMSICKSFHLFYSNLKLFFFQHRKCYVYLLW